MEHQLLEAIDNYLMGNLSSEAAKDFEAQMEQDAVLKKAVQQQEELIAGMKAFEEKQDFFSMMEEIKKEKDKSNLTVVKESATATISSKETDNIRTLSPSKKKTNRLRPLLAIAATVSLLLVAGLFWMQGSTVDTGALAQQQFDLYPEQITARLEASGAVTGDNEAIQNLLIEGTAAYNQNDLPVAKQKWTAFKDQSNKRGYLQLLTDFYLSQIALSEKNYSHTIQLLEPLSKEQGLPIADAVHWYLALAYLGTEETAKAKTSLQKIAANSKFARKAQTVLGQLK